MIEDLAGKIRAIFDDDNIYPGQLEGAIVNAIREAGYTYTIHNERFIVGNGEKFLFSIDFEEEEVELI